MNDFIIWNSKDTDYYNIEILNADVINTIKSFLDSESSVSDRPIVQYS